MSFTIAVKKKGMSTTELAREFSINQKSPWLFKRKGQHSMKSSGNYPLDGKVEVDELFKGGSVGDFDCYLNANRRAMPQWNAEKYAEMSRGMLINF